MISNNSLVTTLLYLPASVPHGHHDDAVVSGRRGQEGSHISHELLLDFVHQNADIMMLESFIFRVMTCLSTCIVLCCKH